MKTKHNSAAKTIIKEIFKSVKAKMHQNIINRNTEIGINKFTTYFASNRSTLEIFSGLNFS
jgi:hypothetical protein